MLRKLVLYTLGAAMLFLAGCGDSLIDNTVTTQYSVQGILFHNPNANSSFCYALIEKEGSQIPSLVARIVTSATDSLQLTPIGAGAYLTPLSELLLQPDSVYTFRADDFTGDFSFSLDLTIPDTFRVQVTNPASHIYTSGSVAITWDPPSDKLGYFVTVVPPTAETAPFTGMANSTSSFSIDPDAFTKSNGDKVVGIYKIYVVAYSETFYSNPNIESSNRIFFPYPRTGFTNNIKRVGVSGRFGSAIISFADSVEVIANP